MSRLSSAEISSPTVTDGDQARARLDALVTELGDDVVGSEVVRNGDIVVRVNAGAWPRAAEVCLAQGYDYFCFLSGLDWMPSTSPNPRALVSDELDTGDDEAPAAEADDEAEAAAPDAETAPPVAADGLGYPTGVAGGDARFQVFARLYSTTRHEGVTLKADLDPDDPRVGTWSKLYPGADWNERETWEMYGFVFDGHPHLVKLYLPGEFEGFPLRKDFPLLSREVKPWPGLVDVEPMPEVPEADTAASESPAPAPEPAPAPPLPAAAAPEPAPEPAAAPETAEPDVPPPAEDSVPETAEEAHATGTESATTVGAAADEADAADAADDAPGTEDPEAAG
ncbi:MAG TPA: NADH-quinone oxidoreductase subunit C [Acidimicrobiales bacterium]